MQITVQVIENKEFSSAPMGYNRKQVDEFLDEICDEMERLNDEIVSLRMQLRQSDRQQAYRAPAPSAAVPAPLNAQEEKPEPSPKAEPAPYAPPAAQPAPAEPEKKDGAQEAAAVLLSAQKVYDETLKDAKREAERILQEAQEKADKQAVLFAQEHEELEQGFKQLKQAARDYKSRLQALLNGQQKLLDEQSSLFDEEE